MLRPDHIRKIVADRRIGHLLHFTFESNLPSILMHGLISRDELARRDNIKALVSDPWRDDEHDDAICLSVSRYQAPMLRRVANDNPKRDLVILVIDPAVLWENSCLFCDGNAASNWIKNTRRNLSTAYAFQAMFDDYYQTTRLENGESVKVSHRILEQLPESVPTDPQAEVLVKGKIALDRILTVWAETVEQGERIKAMLEDVPYNNRPDLFIDGFSFGPCDDN